MVRGKAKQSEPVTEGSADTVTTASATPTVDVDSNKFPAYRGAKSLPDFKVITPGNNERGTSPKIQLAAPRYAAMMCGPNTYKVVQYFKTPRGVTRKLWRILKVTKNRERDKALFRELRAAGVPGIL